MLLIFPIIFLLVYFGAGIFYEPELIIYVKPFIIPSFMVYAMINNYNKISLNFYFFAFFFYVGETLLLIDYKNVLIMRFALLSYLFCYMSLIILAYDFVLKIKISKILNGLTLIIFILNVFFLGCILYLILISVEDFFTNIIVVLNAISAVILGVVAVLILGESNKIKPYFYFFGSFALIFNDIFSAIQTYYLESVILNTFDRILHFLAFVLFYLYAINIETSENKKLNKYIYEFK